MITPFHIAFPVDNLEKARDFYKNVLKCKEGRSSESWVDFDMFGHQVVAHLAPEEVNLSNSNSVDGKSVPVRHFGVILEWSDWENLCIHLKNLSTDFIIEPYIRFKGLPGEQGTLFIEDPAGNALEFKSFKDMNQIFAK